MRPNAPAWRPSVAALLCAASLLPAAAADKPCAEAGKAIDGVTSLRDALSQLLALGASRLAVRGDDGTLLGSLGIDSILAASRPLNPSKEHP